MCFQKVPYISDQQGLAESWVVSSKIGNYSWLPGKLWWQLQENNLPYARHHNPPFVYFLPTFWSSFMWPLALCMVSIQERVMLARVQFQKILLEITHLFDLEDSGARFQKTISPFQFLKASHLMWPLFYTALAVSHLQWVQVVATRHDKRS